MKKILFLALASLFLLNGIEARAQRIENSSRSTIAYIQADGRIENSSRSTIGYFNGERVENRSRSTSFRKVKNNPYGKNGGDKQACRHRNGPRSYVGIGTDEQEPEKRRPANGLADVATAG